MRASKRILTGIVTLLWVLPVFGEDGRKAKSALIWQERDISELNLLEGPGGKDHQPGKTFRFILELTTGTAPKFLVEDENGVTWKVKLGPETKPETAATRLLWAAGYFVDEAYYRPEIRVEGMKRLARGQNYVSARGVATGVRLERQDDGGADKGVDDGEDNGSEHWSWYDDSFDGTREFNGLRVMMARINNWDLKTLNNAISIGDDAQARYEITDLGASFGRTGDTFTRSKGNVKDYAESKFVEKVTPNYVNLVMHSRPYFLTIFALNNYMSRTRMETVAKHIPIADARWIGDRLAQLSAEQIRDCFRAAGFSTDEVEVYARVLTQRIAALVELEPSHVGAAAQREFSLNESASLYEASPPGDIYVEDVKDVDPARARQTLVGDAYRGKFSRGPLPTLSTGQSQRAVAPSGPPGPFIVLKDGGRLEGVLQKYENGLAFILVPNQNHSKSTLATLPRNQVDEAATVEAPKPN